MVSYPVLVSGLCLQSCLLMQLPPIVLSKPLSGQSDNCSMDEYWSWPHCCKRCSAGEFVRKSCTIAHTLGQCEQCPPGAFTEYSNGLQSCITCSSCDKNQEIVAECSATSDRKCQCQMGHFYSSPESYEVCRQCTKCPQGIPVLQECNSTANTVCKSAATYHRRRLYLFAAILLLLACVALACCYQRNGSLYNAVE